MGTLCVVYNLKHRLGGSGVRILQVRVNFACYYRTPKEWNPETYTRLQKYILKYSAVPAKLNDTWIYFGHIIAQALSPCVLIHLIRIPYFVYSLRLMCSCNLWILFVRQHNEGRSVAQHACVVLFYNAVSEYHVAVAVATAVTELDAL